MTDNEAKLLIGISCAIVGSVITFLITRYKIKKDRDLARAKDWVEDFKMSVGDLCKYTSQYHHGENVVPIGADKHSEFLMLANAERYRLKLILDPNVENERLALTRIEQVVFAMFEGNAPAGSGGSVLHKSIEELLVIARKIVVSRESKF